MLLVVMTTAVMKWKKRDEEEIQTREKAEMARRISMGQEINLNRTSLRVKINFRILICVLITYYTQFAIFFNLII